MTHFSLTELRADFEARANRSVSMPIAGAIVWFMVAALALVLPEKTATLALLFATGGIFPIALLIAKIRNEHLTDASNPLSKLMGMCVLMVNLLWALHVPLFLYAPQFVVLSLGISLGLHWVVYSWIVQHPAGIIHAFLRSLLICLVWFLMPEQRIFAASCAIIFCYWLSIYQMLTRPIPSSDQTAPAQAIVSS